MTITDITEQKRKGRVNVYLDGEYGGSLYLEVLITNGFKKGDQVTSERFNQALKEDNGKYALDRALHYLSYSARSQAQMEEYLKEKGIGAEAIAATIERLKGYGYIDDFDYAQRFLDNLMGEGKSKAAAKQKLYERKLSKEAIEQALTKCNQEDEAENARVLFEKLERKYSSYEERKKRDSIYRGMAQRGFSYETIKGLFKSDIDE